MSRHSTVGWTPTNALTPEIIFSIPKDFGSQAYYQRSKELLQTWIDGLRTAHDPLPLYDRLLEDSLLIRDYLWVADEAAADLGRKGLQIIPRSDVCSMLTWVIQDFWERQHGWPDLLVEHDSVYLFAEVKSPNDRLSQAQMRWFRWALENSIPCELIRVSAATEGKD